MTVSDTQLHALDPVLDEHYQRAQGRAEGGLLDRVVGAVVGLVQAQPDPADLDTLASDLFAVVDALSVYGVRHVDMPATPQKIWRLIQEHRPAIAAE